MRGSWIHETLHPHSDVELPNRHRDRPNATEIQAMKPHLECSQGDCFTKSMDKYLPDRSNRRDRLTGAPLSIVIL